MYKEEFVLRDDDMMVNMKMEVDNVGQMWGGIFNVAWPSPNWPRDQPTELRCTRCFRQGIGSQEALQLPHVVLWAQRVLQGLSTKYLGLVLVKVAYVQATSDQPQLWHRDLLLELQTVAMEHAFSCFMPVNLNCPMDGGENMFFYGSGRGGPYPWPDVSMSMLAGNLWILSSYVIHCGGAVPTDALPGSTRIIAFAAIATRCVDYETTVPILPPTWAEAPAQQPSPLSPKVVHCAAAQCSRRVKANPPLKCFACDERPLCAVHVRQLSEDCQRDSGDPAQEAAPGPAVEAAPGPTTRKLYIPRQKQNQKGLVQTDRGWETNDGDERGGGVLVGLPRCHRVGADRGHGKRNSTGGISSKCVYSH